MVDNSVEEFDVLQECIKLFWSIVSKWLNVVNLLVAKRTEWKGEIQLLVDYQLVCW